MKKSLTLKIVALCFVCSFLTGIVVYASVPSNIMVLSGGVYPGSSSYSVYVVDLTYYAKDQNGVNQFSGASCDDVVNDIVDDLDGSGGTIIFATGTFYVDETIYYNENLHFIGQSNSDDTGDPGTVIQRTADVPIFDSIEGGTSQVRHISFEKMTLRDTDNTTGTEPLLILDYTGGVVVDRVTFSNSGGDGLYLANATYWTTVSNCQGVFLAGYFITDDHTGGTTLNIENCIGHWCGGIVDIYGQKTFNILGGGGDTLYGTAYHITLCQGTIFGVDIEGIDGTPSLGHGFFFVHAFIQFSGNRILWYGDGWSYYPIYASSGTIGLISGNTFSETQSNTDIGLAGDAGDLGICDNFLSDTALYGVYPYTTTNLFMKNNDNWITENQGNSTGTGGQQTIAHGCDFTPSYNQVTLTERSTGGAVPYQSAPPDGTNIYVTATSAKDYTWTVQIYP